MKKSVKAQQRRRSADRSRRFLKRSGLFLIAVIFAAAIAVLSVFQLSPTRDVMASPNPEPTPQNQRRYIATKRIIVDKQTGQLRMPTTEETDKLVADLTELTKRPEDGLVQRTTAGRGVSIDLEGGYAGVMLGRPNPDGTFETRCVFTFDEGAEFMGLVAQNPGE